MIGRSVPKVDVLLVEPDSALVSILEPALTANNAAVTSVPSKEEALKVLARLRRPELVIMELELPDGSGAGLLGFLKSEPDLRHIPVVVLARAPDPVAVDEAWDLFANCVISKPEISADLDRAVSSLAKFWLGPVVLPRSLQARAARF